MDSTSTETVALIAAGGAILGALIGAASGGVVDYLLERQREKRRAKIGGRLVRLDLREVVTTLRGAETTGRWAPAVGLAMRAWPQYQDALSAQLSTDDRRRP